MNAYEVMLEVDGRGVTRTEWANTATDAFQMALMNASAAQMGMAKKIRFVHIGPPQVEVFVAQQELLRLIEAATKAATAEP